MYRRNNAKLAFITQVLVQTIVFTVSEVTQLVIIINGTGEIEQVLTKK